MTKKIVLLTGSPHYPGTSSTLADEFEKGALENKNDVFRFDAGLSKNITPIKVEGPNSEEIPVKDDITTVIQRIIESDLVVFSSPLYYFGFPAQLKMVVDRFYSSNHYLKDKQSIMLATGYGDAEDFKPLQAYYHILANYMRWDNIGELIAANSNVIDDLGNYKELAYKMGQKIK